MKTPKCLTGCIGYRNSKPKKNERGNNASPLILLTGKMPTPREIKGFNGKAAHRVNQDSLIKPELYSHDDTGSCRYADIMLLPPLLFSPLASVSRVQVL